MSFLMFINLLVYRSSKKLELILFVIASVAIDYTFKQKIVNTWNAQKK